MEEEQAQRQAHSKLSVPSRGSLCWDIVRAARLCGAWLRGTEAHTTSSERQRRFLRQPLTGQLLHETQQHCSLWGLAADVGQLSREEWMPGSRQPCPPGPMPAWGVRPRVSGLLAAAPVNHSVSLPAVVWDLWWAGEASKQDSLDFCAHLSPQTGELCSVGKPHCGSL